MEGKEGERVVVGGGVRRGREKGWVEGKEGQGSGGGWRDKEGERVVVVSGGIRGERGGGGGWRGN